MNSKDLVYYLDSVPWGILEFKTNVSYDFFIIEATAQLNHVAGKCDVMYGNDGCNYLSNFQSCGRFKFYFEEVSFLCYCSWL